MNQPANPIAADRTVATGFAHNPLSRYDTRKNLQAYSVDLELLQHITEYFNSGIPTILSPVREKISLSDYTTVTISSPEDITVFKPAATFTQKLFDSDTEAVTMELKYRDLPKTGPGPAAPSAPGPAIVILLGLSRTSGDSYISIALQDAAAEEKVRRIEEGLLAVIKPFRVSNRLFYPNEFIPTLLLVAGFLIGLFGMMSPQKIIRVSTTLIFAIAIFVASYRFTRGYCVFRSRRQKRSNIFLTLIGGAMIAVILASILK